MKRRVVEGTEAFREELLKRMPGYQWVVHKSFSDTRIEATGSQSSGFNRLSTLSVVRTEDGDSVWYEAKSAGFGLKAPWKHTTQARSLAKALRQLQEHYERQAMAYGGLASDLEKGRQPGRSS